MGILESEFFSKSTQANQKWMEEVDIVIKKENPLYQWVILAK